MKTMVYTSTIMSSPPPPADAIHLPVRESAKELRLRTWLLTVRATALIERRIVTMLGRHDVTLPQFDVLATLRFSDGITQQELASRLLVTKGNVCGLLDRLERLGWVQRRVDARDARVNHLHLTPAGRRRVDTLVPAHDALVLEALRALSDEQVESMGKVLSALERTNG
jgi:DNA-binding MarR family transcriptional regulator